MARTIKKNVVSSTVARTQISDILKRAGDRDERFVVERAGEPAVIILSLRDFIRNIAPTPPAFRAIRAEAKRKGVDTLSDRDIEREIAAVRRERAKRGRKQPAA
jgi:PHD/YefM family antitoxin component YafN of YafNO toxin-antitoxin module